MTEREELEGILEQVLMKHHDDISKQDDDAIAEATESILEKYVKKSDILLDEEKILKVIMNFWRNPPRQLCEYRDLPDGFAVKFRKEDLAHALSQEGGGLIK